jgi:hypothetical protein
VFSLKKLENLDKASKPNLSFIMLSSFLVSFAVARVFTYFFPSTMLVVQNIHVHHFWFGLALLVVGGWLGINYRDDEIDRLAAIIFGVGGGLVGDEVGLLLTFGNYYSELTYTFLIALLAFSFMAALFRRHGKAIITELYGFSRSHVDLYVGVFLVFISSAFLIQSDDVWIIVLGTVAFAFGLALIARRIIRFLRTVLT